MQSVDFEFSKKIELYYKYIFEINTNLLYLRGGFPKNSNYLLGYDEILRREEPIKEVYMHVENQKNLRFQCIKSETDFLNLIERVLIIYS
jgi:hypothetical protein